MRIRQPDGKTALPLRWEGWAVTCNVESRPLRKEYLHPVCEIPLQEVKRLFRVILIFYNRLQLFLPFVHGAYDLLPSGSAEPVRLRGTARSPACTAPRIFLTLFCRVQRSKIRNFLAEMNAGDPLAARLRYPRRESNPDLRFRKPPFYPLNYKGLRIFNSSLRGRCNLLASTVRSHCRFRNPAL